MLKRTDFFSGSTTYLQSTAPIIVRIHHIPNQVPVDRVSRKSVNICEKFWVKWLAQHFIGMMFKIITTKSIIATKSNTRTTLSFPNHSTILSYLEILCHHPPNSSFCNEVTMIHPTAGPSCAVGKKNKKQAVVMQLQIGWQYTEWTWIMATLFLAFSVLAWQIWCSFMGLFFYCFK